VKEYWIILAATRQAEVYRHPEGGVYREMRLVEASGILECSSLPEIQIKLNDPFA
jgi:Uma2 family endonuclease